MIDCMFYIITSDIANIITAIITISIVLIIILENRTPLKAIAWVAIVSLIPILGVVLYIMFGQDKRRKHRIHKNFYELLMHKPKNPTVIQHRNKILKDLERYETSINLINSLDDSPMLPIDDIKTFVDGKTMFSSMFEDIRKATKSIHILSYIIEDDSLFSSLCDILKEKANDGIKIRIIYDHIGSYSVHKRRWAELKKYGIESYPFMKVLFPILSSSINYRNHRKITVIDGSIAYIGGMNIANRYLGDTEEGYWRDTHFRLTGQAVYSIQSYFLSDWYSVSQKIPNVKNCFPDIPDSGNNILSQFICSGPIEEYKNIEQTLVSLIHKATKSICIQTPYLLPTNVLNDALTTASLSGIKVEIMIPNKGDNLITSWAIDSFLSPLLRAGINIYRYKKGFLHSKIMMIDGEVSVIGSSNMDFRSFEHNFEIVGVIYNSDFCKSLESVFDLDKKDCVLIDPVQWDKCSKWIKLRNGFMRLFSPLL